MTPYRGYHEEYNIRSLEESDFKDWLRDGYLMDKSKIGNNRIIRHYEELEDGGSYYYSEWGLPDRASFIPRNEMQITMSAREEQLANAIVAEAIASGKKNVEVVLTLRQIRTTKRDGDHRWQVAVVVKCDPYTFYVGSLVDYTDKGKVLVNVKC